MTFEVVLLPGAQGDIDEILTWIHRRSPEGALAWWRAWLTTVAELEQFADHFSLAPESAWHSQVILNRIFKTRRGKPYRVLFTIRSSIVYVLHVRGPGQDILKADELRKPPTA